MFHVAAWEIGLSLRYVWKTFQVEVLQMNQSMTNHVNARQTLLQNNVTNQRLVLVAVGLHVYKSNFVKDGTKPFDLNPHRSAHFRGNPLLRSCFDFDLR